MKKLLYLLLLAALLPSCKNKDLIICDHSESAEFRVIIHWEDETVKPDRGMMTNFLPLGNSPTYGREFLESCDGGKVGLPFHECYKSICYDYYADHINFTEDHLEAYCLSMIRATYSKAFPDENTVQQPGGAFWVDRVDEFEVDGNDLDFYMKNVAERFTFEVWDIEGIEYIVDTRGAISGMSASYFLADGSLSAQPYSILFDAHVDEEKGIIAGSFTTFGRLETDNNFTIEILYPSRDGGIIYGTWDVTDQVIHAEHLPDKPDILIRNNHVIPPIVPSGNSVFEPDVDDWEDIIVTIPM